MHTFRAFGTVLLLFVISALLVFLSIEAPVVRSAADPGKRKSLENYDIRTDRSPAGIAKRSELAAREGAGDNSIRSARERIEQAAADFKAPESRVIENGVMDVPEVISPEVGSTFLTPPSTRPRKAIFTDYLKGQNELLGVNADSIEELSVAADYTNPDGNLSFVVLRQSVDGIPVFSGEVKAGFTQKNEIIRVINNLAPAARSGGYAERFGPEEEAIARASQYVPGDVVREHTTVEKMLFPVEVGALRPAWRVFFETATEAFYVMVDAEDGTLLWRKNLTEQQSVAATYGAAYTQQFGLMQTADSPTPGTPFGCAAPTGCFQPIVIGRGSRTLIGNEGANSFNNLGWIPDTGLPVRDPANPNITDGNNVEAGIDRDGTNGVDPQGHAVGSPNRVFNAQYNPAPGNPPPGENPTPPNPQTYPPTPYQQGITTHAFYTANRWHDAAYMLGFTEQAGNFQHFNFGRGGAEGDRLSIEVQDSSGTNGATFTVPADGGRGRMQMMLWTGPTPDRDGALDSQVLVHEISHGISSRLHGNATGLTTNMARGMGEGWSDFFALAMLSEPNDPLAGVHAVGSYITYSIFPGYESNYYYGLRRFPMANKAFTGPNGKPHNPLTFRYLNADCNDLIGTTTNGPNSAYPRGPIGVNTCDQTHNLGEVWNAVLWEVRSQLIRRHGGSEGNIRALKYVMDGMKISPLNPNMVQARDAILIAAQAAAPADLLPAWRGFALRGMGEGAAVVNPGSGANNTVVTESFAVPVAYRRAARADFDGDGRSDVSVFRPSNGNWYMNRSTAGFSAVNWGLSGDIPIANDFDGDGKADIAVYRNGAQSVFYILRSSDLTISIVGWGVDGDIPAVEDYDGDRKHDVTIFRPSTQMYWVLKSSDGSPIAARSDRTDPLSRPITGDFDGDGKADFGTVRNGRWIIYTSAANYGQTVFLSLPHTDAELQVPADYDGDHVDDIAYYRPSDGTWHIRRSGSGTTTVESFGIATDRPVPGDYDGDGRADIAVYRDGFWWINGTTTGLYVTQFGLTGDKALPAGNTQ